MSRIHFVCDDLVLERLNADVEHSAYSTRAKYLSAQVEFVLSLPSSEDSSSLALLIYVAKTFYSLPVEQVKRLAIAQNRNFAQMLKHLVEIALCQYSDSLAMPSVSAETTARRPLSTGNPLPYDFSLLKDLQISK